MEPFLSNKPLLLLIKPLLLSNKPSYFPTNTFYFAKAPPFLSPLSMVCSPVSLPSPSGRWSILWMSLISRLQHLLWWPLSPERHWAANCGQSPQVNPPTQEAALQVWEGYHTAGCVLPFLHKTGWKG